MIYHGQEENTLRNTEKDELEMTARREKMLAEGFRLFSEKGIGQVTMQQIADACDTGIATLYRYYNTKLTFVIAIGTQKWEQFGETIRKLRLKYDTAHMNAATELEFYFDCYIMLYTDHKDLLCFNQDFNNYVQHEGATLEQMKSYLEAISTFAAMFREVYEKGKIDGTIRTDLPEEKMFAATSHIMIAVAVRYAQGLLWMPGNEADRTEEYKLLKRMLLREYVI